MKTEFLETIAMANIRRSNYDSMCEVIPPGVSGSAQIRHFTLTSDSVALPNLRAMRDGFCEFLCCPGKYAALTIDGKTVMSDTPMERLTNHWIAQAAFGRVLIAGLGLGMVPYHLAQLSRVDQIDIVEINPDVIQLVHPRISHPKIRIQQCGIEEFGRAELDKPKADRLKWDAIYFDIWPTITYDDQPQITRLKRMFRPLLNREGCMGAWAEDLRKRTR